MRLIDAEPIIKNLSAMKTQLGYDAIDIDGMIKALREAEVVTDAYPPNAPLTLEELREMVGEPVWISPAKEKGKVPARWMLVSGYNPNKNIYLFAPSCNITQGYDGKSYGKTWLAYRRRSEEGTE